MPRARWFNGVCRREGARSGYTPVNASEWDDAQEFLEETFLPALRLSIGGTNATATRARVYRTNRKTWQTVVELTYKGKRWSGHENGHWVDCHFLLMTFRYVKGGLPERRSDSRVIPRFIVAWGGYRNLCADRQRNGYKECQIGHPAWDELADRVLAIMKTGHTKTRKFTGRVIEIVVKFHLDSLAMVAKVNSQIAGLRGLDDSDDEGEEPAESEGGTGSDHEPQFFVRPLFASGGGGHKERCAITARE
jgi:hypothetical protein